MRAGLYVGRCQQASFLPRTILCFVGVCFAGAGEAPSRQTFSGRAERKETLVSICRYPPEAAYSRGSGVRDRAPSASRRRPAGP